MCSCLFKNMVSSGWGNFRYMAIVKPCEVMCFFTSQHETLLKHSYDISADKKK